jgi:flagellar biosynthesis anti-sigma factor FlgM
MKIENDRSGALAGADGVGRTANDPSGAARTAPQSGAPRADQLTLSPEARLLQAAADASSSEPAIRQDVVDRMRELVDAGKVGNDPDALAGAIVDDWLAHS